MSMRPMFVWSDVIHTVFSLLLDLRRCEVEIACLRRACQKSSQEQDCPLQNHLRRVPGSALADLGWIEILPRDAPPPSPLLLFLPAIRLWLPTANHQAGLVFLDLLSLLLAHLSSPRLFSAASRSGFLTKLPNGRKVEGRRREWVRGALQNAQKIDRDATGPHWTG